MEKRIFSALFFSIFSAILGVGIVVPLLPVYAVELGATGFYTALIFGSFSFSRAIFLPYFGKASDNKGRKAYILTGLFIYALVSFGLIIFKDINAIIWVRALQGIGSAMVLPVAQAYIGDITPTGKEGSIMGLFNISLYGGLSIGPLVGGMIKDTFNIQASFTCMGLFAIVSFLLCLVMLPSRKYEQRSLTRNKSVKYLHLLRDEMIRSLFLFRLAYTTCIGIVWLFLPILASKKFELQGFSIGILVMSGVLIAGLLQIPMGILSDRVDKRMLVIVGGLITVIGISSFEFASCFWDLFFSTVAYGVGGGVSMPALMAISVVKGKQFNSMGSVMALLTMAHNFGMFLGAIFAGIIMDLYELQYVFLSGTVVMMAGIAIFFVNTIKKGDISTAKK